MRRTCRFGLNILKQIGHCELSFARTNDLRKPFSGAKRSSSAPLSTRVCEAGASCIDC